MAAPETFIKCHVAYSTDGASTWTSTGDIIAAVSVDGGDRETAETFFFDDDVPRLTSGPRSAITVTVRYGYEENSPDELFEDLWTAYETDGGGDFDVRYTSLGAVAGNYRFTTENGQLKNPGLPQGEAGSADAVLNEFVIECEYLTKDAYS